MAGTPALDGDRGLTRAERASITETLLERARRASTLGGRRRLLEEVILINRGVAESVASRYRRRGVAQDDLDQAAYEGLVKAVYRFDPDRSRDLLTYAVPTIRGELQRHFRDHGWSVRPPRRVQELQWRVGQCVDELTQRLGREPSDSQVRDELDVSREEYDEAVVAFGCFSPTSLDQPLALDTTDTVADVIADESADTGGSLEAAEARTTLEPVLRGLPDRDKRILYLRYFEDQTQEQIGEELGVTQMQVSRLLSRILRDLRDALGEAA